MVTQLPPGSFYGQIQKRHQFGQLTFVESTAAPGQRVPNHKHARAYFYLVLRGSCTETFENKTRSVGPLTLVFHPRECVHASQWLQQGGTCFIVEIPAALHQRVHTQVELVDDLIEFPSGNPVWLAARLYREFQQVDGLTPLAMEGLTLEMLAALARAGQHRSERTGAPWLARVRDLLHDRFAEPLALDEIAGAVGVHAVHLCRAFRRQFHCTPGDYVRELRVNFASRELSRSSRSLAEIALAAGFVDQSHFSNTFRRATGMAPGEFRRQFRAR